jgi:hypothetical protein
METITRFLDHLYQLPKGRTVGPEEDQEQFLVQWGYTIYRTYYGPGSDEQWSKLLKDITDGVAEALTELEEAVKEPDTLTKIRDQFRLDARSDPATLDGSTLEDVRQVYLEGSGGQPMRGIQPCNFGIVIFLLADAEVLQDPDLRLLKVADARYDPVAAVPRNTRSGPQRNFGWLTIPTTAVLDFYNWMDIFT